MKKVLVGDLETDGLKDTISKIHCMWTATADDDETFTGFRPEDLDEMQAHLENAEALVFHNGIDYDYPVLKMFYPSIKFPQLIDTLVLSRLVYPNIFDLDRKLTKQYLVSRGARGLPPKLQGSHGLKAWGYRLGLHKGDYGQQEDAWSVFNEEMYVYCRLDVEVTVKLYALLKRKVNELGIGGLPFTLEHESQTYMTKLNENGFKFNVEKAQSLFQVLSQQRFELTEELVEKYGSWYANNGTTTPKKTLRYKEIGRPDLTAGAMYCKIKLVQFNPSSRDHIAKKLIEHGWTPREFTKTGKPKINDEILEDCHIPEAQLLCKYLTLQKRISQLAEGDNAWLTKCNTKGFIHHSVNPNGAVTTRATHSRPNLAQVPASGKLWGAECRELFIVPEGWVLFGSDASGLELRALAHFLEKFDGGNYIKVVLDGDVHTANQLAAGLAQRSEAKKFIYSFLYGAGDEYIGALIGYTDKEFQQWKREGKGKDISAQLKNRGVQPTTKMVCHIIKGRIVKRKFLKGLPALKNLIDECKLLAKEQGYIIGLDGRRIFTRSQRASLNTLLQAAGAMICKLWVNNLMKLAEKHGFKHGFDGDYALCAWVHDEVQIACRTQEIAEKFKELSAIAMTMTEKTFKFKCRLDVGCDTGQSWNETH
jgi:DNA polymerase-1